MINIDEVNRTITELENSDTTFANCQKLAYLYIVRDNYKTPLKSMETTSVNEVKKELGDILPQYHKYCELKRRYQMHELNETVVLDSMQEVCREIKEFINTLYSSTDMPEEREKIKNMILDLQTL